MNLKKKIEDIFDVSAEPAVDIVSSIFLEGVVGTVVPGVTGAVLAYKQKRSHKMLEVFMRETQARQQELEDKLVQLEEQQLKEFKDKYFGLVTDYVLETKQEEKIQYIVNGFINIASQKSLQEDVILVYYDILNELNMLDIRVLKMHGMLSDDGYYKIIEDTGIDHDQYTLIQNKLERLGLIETRGQQRYEELYENVKHMGDFLTQLEKGKKAKLEFKKPSAMSIKTYVITRLGREFLKFFVTNESTS